RDPHDDRRTRTFVRLSLCAAAKPPLCGRPVLSTQYSVLRRQDGVIPAKVLAKGRMPPHAYFPLRRRAEWRPPRRQPGAGAAAAAARRRVRRLRRRTPGGGRLPAPVPALPPRRDVVPARPA